MDLLKDVNDGKNDERKEKPAEVQEITNFNQNNNNEHRQEDMQTSCSENVHHVDNMPRPEDMIERLLLRCRECEERYSDEKVPRNLRCGHSMCTECLDKCITDKKRCPECHEKQLAKKATDEPINYPLLRINRSVMNREIDLKDIILPEVPANEPVCDIYCDAGQCPVHGSRLVFLCVSCSLWVCQDCLVTDHPYLPRGSCKILNLKEAMENIKRESKRHTDRSKTDIEHIHKSLECVMDKINLCSRLECCGDRSHNRIARKVENDLENLKKEDETTVATFMKQINVLNETIDKTTSAEEITLPCKQILDCVATLKAHIAREKDRTTPVLQTIFSHFRMDLKYVMTKSKPVYVVHEVLGKTKYSQMAYKQNRLIMYSLKEDVPPSNSITVPYAFLKEFLPQENSTVFFEVGTSEEKFGRVYVKLDNENDRTKQTRLLCTGEIGPCYRNTCFFEYSERNATLKGGDYQNNDGTGGHAIVPDLEDCDLGICRKKIKGAFVLDDELFAQFYFHIKATADIAYNVVGFVTLGLEYLVKASKVQPVTNAVVRDCGLFIPMPRIDNDDDNL